MCRGRLSVGTNFDPALVDSVSSIPAVRDLFGTLPFHVFGHGRPRASVPQVGRSDVEAHIRHVHSVGLRFTYLFNGCSIGGRHLRPAEQREVREHLEWAEAAGADAITVSTDWLVSLIKLKHPRLKVKVSHNAQVRTVEQARVFEGLGADMITLHQTAVRNLPLVRRMAAAVGVPFQIICTIDCMPGCPNSIGYHMSGTSTLSSSRQAPNDHNRHASGYCFSWCHLKKLEHPEEILKGGFVRPEDLGVYEAAGVHEFKLDTRVLTTPHILERAARYASRKTGGDLKRLLSVFSLGYKTRVGGQMGSGVASDVDFGRTLVLEGDALDGFLGRFERGLCDMGCSTCEHCRAFARTSMRWDPSQRALAADVLRSYRDWLLNR